jgi:hypothetical protein
MPSGPGPGLSSKRELRRILGLALPGPICYIDGGGKTNDNAHSPRYPAPGGRGRTAPDTRQLRRQGQGLESGSRPSDGCQPGRSIRNGAVCPTSRSGSPWSGSAARRSRPTPSPANAGPAWTAPAFSSWSTPPWPATPEAARRFRFRMRFHLWHGALVGFSALGLYALSWLWTWP